MLASLTSMITGLCYTEFAVETPVAGSAYNFVSMSFGEFAGYLCGCNLALELTIAAAAVARGWTSYVATLFHASPDALRIRVGPPAGGERAAGRRSSSTSRRRADRARHGFARVRSEGDGAVQRVRHRRVVAGDFFVITLGGLSVEKENWTPFAPGGVEGVLAGAPWCSSPSSGSTPSRRAGGDAGPGRDLPVGILGSLGICAVLYAAMALVITGMVPTADIDVQAPFAVAFRDRGMPWAESLISFGAVAAITTALLSSLMGQPRVYMAMARDGLLPSWFGKVHPSLGTPVNASAFTGASVAALALTVDIETLAQLVSIGTLAIFGRLRRATGGAHARTQRRGGEVRNGGRKPGSSASPRIIACRVRVHFGSRRPRRPAQRRGRGDRFFQPPAATPRPGRGSDAARAVRARAGVLATMVLIASLGRSPGRGSRRTPRVRAGSLVRRRRHPRRLGPGRAGGGARSGSGGRTTTTRARELSGGNGRSRRSRAAREG